MSYSLYLLNWLQFLIVKAPTIMLRRNFHALFMKMWTVKDNLKETWFHLLKCIVIHIPFNSATKC